MNSLVSAPLLTACSQLTGISVPCTLIEVTLSAAAGKVVPASANAPRAAALMCFADCSKMLIVYLPNM